MARITFTKAVVDRTRRGPDAIMLVFELGGNDEELTEQEARGTAEKWLKRVGFGQCTVLTLGKVKVDGGLFDGQESDGVVEEVVSLGGDDSPVTTAFTKAVVTRGKDGPTPDRVNLFFEFPDGSGDVEDLIQELPHGAAEKFLKALSFDKFTLVEPGMAKRTRGRRAGQMYETMVETEVTIA